MPNPCGIGKLWKRTGLGALAGKPAYTRMVIVYAAELTKGMTSLARQLRNRLPPLLARSGAPAVIIPALRHTALPHTRAADPGHRTPPT